MCSLNNVSRTNYLLDNFDLCLVYYNFGDNIGESSNY